MQPGKDEIEAALQRIALIGPDLAMLLQESMASPEASDIMMPMLTDVAESLARDMILIAEAYGNNTEIASPHRASFTMVRDTLVRNLEHIRRYKY